MAEQIKPDNKNYSQPLKHTFQTNIFKYVQKKKQELSVFAALNQNHSHSKDKHSSTSSNLIKQNTTFDFYQPSNSSTIDPEMLLTARIKLQDKKMPPKCEILKRKLKGHKYSLSDWRMLYDERNQIVEKRELKQNSPDKMTATDRLFYPSKNESGSAMEKSCSRHNIKQKRQRDGQSSLRKEDRFFVSDQNFFHMYHRSVTPINSDYAEKKRIKKYLHLNKERIENGNGNGLRLMNEGILSNLSKNDVAFVPYKFQLSQSESKILNSGENETPVIKKHQKNWSMLVEHNFDMKQLMEGRKTHMQRMIKIPKQLRIKVDSQTLNLQQKQIEDDNPELNYLNPSKELSEKNHINLSELFQNPNGDKGKHQGELRLRLFKPKKNKIESGISNSKKSQSQNKFANFQYSIKLPQSKKTSLNTTKYSTTKWVQ